MQKLIFAFTLSLFSLLASAKETWVIKDMPQVKYLFRLTNNNDPKDALATGAALVEEAKKYKLTYSKTVFFKLDLKKQISTESGLEVSGPELEKVPVELIKVRPAGKYLIGHYAGKQSRQLYKSITKQFEQKKLTARDTGAFMYSKNPGTDKAILILIFPVN